MEPESAPGAFRDLGVVADHLRGILGFWSRAADARTGGYVDQLNADGTVYDAETRHLVASARFVVLFATGVVHGCGDEYRDAAARALAFLADAHRDRHHGGFHWVLRATGRGVEVVDPRKQAYGHAFVLLAGAMGLRARVPGAGDLLDHAVEIVEERLLAGHDLAINTASADWSEVAAYRGQNANMHLCEAFLATYEATGEERFLDRAHRIADALARRIPTRHGGFVWENYGPDWSPDWTDRPRDEASFESAFGISPGHQVEWAKLLGILARHHDAEWLLPQAVHLHRLAWDFGWDRATGGFHSGLGRDLSVSHPAPAYWAPAEAIGAAAVLLERTGNDDYWDHYDRAWQYALTHLVDHENGGWFTEPALPRDRRDFRKGDGLESDYHPAGACAEVLRSLGPGAG